MPSMTSIGPVIVMEYFASIFLIMMGAIIRLALGPAIRNRITAFLYFYQAVCVVSSSFFSSPSVSK
jgi:hypothetical protein